MCLEIIAPASKAGRWRQDRDAQHQNLKCATDILIGTIAAHVEGIAGLK